MFLIVWLHPPGAATTPNLSLRPTRCCLTRIGIAPKLCIHYPYYHSSGNVLTDYPNCRNSQTLPRHSHFPSCVLYSIHCLNSYVMLTFPGIWLLHYAYAPSTLSWLLCCTYYMYFMCLLLTNATLFYTVTCTLLYCESTQTAPAQPAFNVHSNHN